MENIKLQTQGTVENYQPTPNLFYDVEGKVLSKNGRELVVEKEVGSRVVEYTLNLKEEREVEEGEDIKVSKEEINSMKFEEREVLDPAYREELGQLLRKLGLADTRANYILVEKLLKLGIEPNQVNIDNYLRSMENLEKIEENLDLDTMVKIFQKGGDLETMSLEEIVLEIDRVNSGEVKIRDIFKKREIDYQEAEEICHEIYGQKMGRDIYDIIIALAREGISLSKENVNRGMETFKKLANLEKLDLEDYLKFIDLELKPTINNLYRLKNNYISSSIGENKYAASMEGFTILEEISPRSLERVLEEEAIELDQANLELARELVLGNLNISREDFYQLKELKDKVDFIKSKLSREDLFRHWDEDILNMDLDRLIERIELEGDKTQPGKVNGLEVGLKELSDLEAGSREVDLSFLDGLKIEDLFEIIKSGKNFKLEDLKNIVEGRLGEEESIDFTILERTLEINTIFKQLGEELPNLDLKQGLDTSLKDLYQASLDLKDLDFRPVWSRELDLIRAEYSKFKVNIDIRTLKDSLKQELDLVELPLREANAYIDGKINRYREVAQLMEEFNSIYKHRNIILPLVIKNGLNMDYRQLRNLSNFLSGKDSLNKLVEENLREGRFEKPEELIGLREKISNCLKEGEDIRQDYFKFMDFFASSGGSMNSGGDNPYFKNQEEASQEDLLLQIPLEIDGFKDLNLFIVKGKASLDKNHMNFKLNIETEDLGHIFMDLEVLGKNIRLSLNEESKLNKYMTILEDMFETRGYNLEIGD